ncbi:MAG: hypothetical protein ACI8Y7_000231 [Candidatus Woesearchaeota archaeon]|jgi:hypothetical protein
MYKKKHIFYFVGIDILWLFLCILAYIPFAFPIMNLLIEASSEISANSAFFSQLETEATVPISSFLGFESVIQSVLVYVAAWFAVCLVLYYAGLCWKMRINKLNIGRKWLLMLLHGICVFLAAYVSSLVTYRIAVDGLFIDILMIIILSVMWATLVYFLYWFMKKKMNFYHLVGTQAVIVIAMLFTALWPLLIIVELIIFSLTFFSLN